MKSPGTTLKVAINKSCLTNLLFEEASLADSGSCMRTFARASPRRLISGLDAGFAELLLIRT
jgi:hypothetical protein